MNYMGSGLAHGCSQVWHRFIIQVSFEKRITYSQMNEIQDGLKKIREYIAHMVLTMDGNIGVPPKCVVNPIQRE